MINLIKTVEYFLVKFWIKIALILFVIMQVIYLLTDRHLVPYLTTTYAANYWDYGFVKRGVIGSLVKIFGFEDYKSAIILFGVSFFLIILTIMVAVDNKITNTEEKKIFRLLSVVTPFTILQLSFDLGRPDYLNLILLIWSLHFLATGRIIYSIILNILGTLIHEAYVIYAVPMLIVVLFGDRRLGKNYEFRRIMLILLYLAPVITVSILLYLFGNSENLVNLAPGTGQEAWSRGLKEIPLDIGFTNKILAGLIIFLIYIWAAGIVIKNEASVKWHNVILLGPTLLLVLGYDYARWSAIIYSVIFIYIYYNVLVKKWVVSSPLSLFRVFVLLTILGPVGIQNIFPIANKFIRYIF